tara:strand:- start:261 stop:1028 length:768 start_codon:yes stop_codon:yes gene_type:complete
VEKKMFFNEIKNRINTLGDFVLFVFNVFYETLSLKFRFSLFLQYMNLIGAQSLSIIIFTGFFTGAVFGLQIGSVFMVFRAEGLMGGATGIALATELAPLITGFLLAGRVGSATTAEIATMVVNEQVEAIEAMGVSPIHYLVTPRVFASAIVMPLLCGVFMFIGVIGSYMAGIYIYSIDEGVFFENLVYLAQSKDIIVGLRKMFFFSFIISLLSCFFGLKASGGAKGVGLATTDSVVKILIYILISDFVISYIEVH